MKTPSKKAFLKVPQGAAGTHLAILHQPFHHNNRNKGKARKKAHTAKSRSRVGR